MSLHAALPICYEAVDPDNRWVARTLERDWECALSAEQALRDEQQRALAEEPEHLTDADREAIRQFAQNIPALWSAASTTPRDRQTIARMLLEQIGRASCRERVVSPCSSRWPPPHHTKTNTHPTPPTNTPTITHHTPP